MFRLILLFTVLFSLSSFGQDTLNSAQVEAKSYQLYSDKNWNELIKFIQKANSSGFDYYYLRIRYAIALFEIKNYRKAAEEFENALDFNSYDEVALEYLYYSHLYSGNYYGARLISGRFSKSFREKINEPAVSLFNEVRLEGARKMSSMVDIGIGDISFYEVGTGQYLGRRISISESFSDLTQIRFASPIEQKQFYASLNLQMSPKLSITPTFHLLNIFYDGEVEKDFAAGFMFTKRTKYFNVSPFFTVANFNGLEQSQKGISLGYYPFGNNMLSATSTINFHQTKTETNYLVFRQSLSIGLKKTILTFDYCKGDEIINPANNNTYIVNNSLDVTNYKISGTVNLQINTRLNWYLFYQHENKSTFEQQNKYDFNTVLTGLKFRFY